MLSVDTKSDYCESRQAGRGEVYRRASVWPVIQGGTGLHTVQTTTSQSETEPRHRVCPPRHEIRENGTRK